MQSRRRSSSFFAVAELLLCCTIFWMVIGTDAVIINTKLYSHNQTHPAVLANNLKVSPELVKLLELQVPANFETVVLDGKYQFKNRHILAKALLHGGYKAKIKKTNQDSYEPLDQIGNMVLEFLVSRHLMLNSQPTMHATQINDMKSAILKQDSLTFVALQRKLDDFLFIEQKDLLGSPLVKFNQTVSSLRSFQELVEREPVAAKRPSPGSFLQRQFKAVIGAIYADSGYNLQAADDAIMPLLKKEIDIIFNRVLRKEKVQ